MTMSNLLLNNFLLSIIFITSIVELGLIDNNDCNGFCCIIFVRITIGGDLITFIWLVELFLLLLPFNCSSCNFFFLSFTSNKTFCDVVVDCWWSLVSCCCCCCIIVVDCVLLIGEIFEVWFKFEFCAFKGATNGCIFWTGCCNCVFVFLIFKKKKIK